MISVLILAAVALASSPSTWATERAECSCWPYQGDKSNYVCDDTSLTSIPDCVPINVTQISIRTSTIPLVPETLRRFTNLYRINVPHFAEPQMSKTFLASQRKIPFFGIYNTPLHYVDPDWFRYTPYVDHLVFADDNIVSLDSQIFSNLPLLESVILRGNQLTTLPPNLFKDKPMKELFLDNNPWHCDCDMANFMQWTRDNNVKVDNKAFCSYPSDLKGVNLKDLTPDIDCP